MAGNLTSRVKIDSKIQVHKKLWLIWVAKSYVCDKKVPELTSNRRKMRKTKQKNGNEIKLKRNMATTMATVDTSMTTFLDCNDQCRTDEGGDTGALASGVNCIGRHFQKQNSTFFVFIFRFKNVWQN